MRFFSAFSIQTASKVGALFFLLSAALSFTSAAHAEAPLAQPQASRPAYKGCVWEPYASKRLGIRLLFQSCSDPSLHYVLKENGDWLEQHRPSDDVTFNGPQIIRVFTKPAGQSIEDAIRKNIIATIRLDDKREQAQARKSCRVVKSDFALKDKRKIALTLMPTGAYEKKIDKELKEGPRDFGCGEYGAGQGIGYFEYHPEQSKTQYAFVVYGMDEPLFDENSIEFIGQ